MRRWFYIDIRKSLDSSVDREEAIVGIPEDRLIRTDFGREIVLDLSSPEREYASLMYPVAQVFDWDKWQDGFDEYWAGDQNKSVRDEFRTFKRQVRIFDLPYQSRIVPLAAILADIGDAWEHEANRAMLVRWYWNGVFGELYGSTVETRIARDFMEVPAWLNGGPEPSTISETIFRSDRLKTMRMRLSAAYKGMNALLMKEGAQDLRSGQKFDHTVFFGENVDIHHIFPQDWCKRQDIKPIVFDSIINKTPLSYRNKPDYWRGCSI